jgi:Ca2+-binding EF-hand superfamily protein
VDNQWKVLSEHSSKKNAKLADDLAREEFKEHLRLLNSEHVNIHKQLSEWIADKTAYLATKESVTSITTAQVALAQLRAYEADKNDTTNVNVKSLKATGQKLFTEEYKTSLSHYKFEAQNDVKGREDFVEKSWSTLDAMSKKKQEDLEAALKLELTKEKLRLDFGSQASDFMLWAKEAADHTSNSHFGFTLQQVEAFDIKGNDNQVLESIESKSTSWKKTYSDIEANKVTDNPYTKLTPKDLTDAGSRVKDAIQTRRTKYEKELAKQRADDTLCKAFAAIADPFVKQIDSDKDAVTNSQADLEAQLAYVEERHKAASSNNKLDEIKAAQAKLDEAGIKNNPYSPMTSRDAEVQWNQYKDFLQAKKTMLAEQIEHKKLRGVSMEQYNEIKQQFAQFDKDKSGLIDLKELKACLYSLGEDRTSQQIKDIMTKYGHDDAKHGGRCMSYDGFKEFMIGMLGDADTKEELVTSFELINRGQAFGQVELMDQILSDASVAYLKQHAPTGSHVTAGSGIDYKAWLASVLAR